MQIKKCFLFAMILIFSLSACAPRNQTEKVAPMASPEKQEKEVKSLAAPSPAASAAPSEEKGASDHEQQTDSAEKILQALTQKVGEFTSQPNLKVYVVDTERAEEMLIEDYLQGVLAGEMKNDWPMEALKAQAILARTFVLKFILEKESQYPDVHVSTDIKEAQAYDATGINDRIAEAIEQTQGQVLLNQGELIYAWFHAHAGGMTALAKEGMNYKDEEPPYIKIVQSTESHEAPPEDAEWQEAFSKEEVMGAVSQAQGLELQDIETIEPGERGASGRMVTLLINGETVNVPDFRIALDSMRMKSTLLTSVRMEDGKILFAGKGYGHGVGMSQWGAYEMAEQGKTAEEIVTHYFAEVELVNLW